MKIQKQLFRHDPENGIYGDCHRTAIACILNMEAGDVPHFMDKTIGKGAAFEEWKAIDDWLAQRDIVQISIPFSGDTPLWQILELTKLNAKVPFILGGESRNKVNHSVVCFDGEIVCDPSLDDSGIIGPCDDGFYWTTFFGVKL